MIQQKLDVVVLMGGNSHEREVSLSTGKQIMTALNPDKYNITVADVADIMYLNEHKPDVVFIALHGPGGEDGSIQGTLQTLGIPYTGSGVLASALAMDKRMSKLLFRAMDISVLPHIDLHLSQQISNEDLRNRILQELHGLPVFIKPNSEGSTFGCSLVNTYDDLEIAISKAFKYDSVIIIEPYIKGIEITVSVLGNSNGPLKSLPAIEIVPKSQYYDYDSKYSQGGSEHIIPARLSDPLLDQAGQVARRCHALLGCKGMSRTDIIVSDDKLYVLEVNTIPGMTPTSLLPQAAAAAGISFADLVDHIICDALMDVRR